MKAARNETQLHHNTTTSSTTARTKGKGKNSGHRVQLN
jgi:hypothetical protein